MKGSSIALVGLLVLFAAACFDAPEYSNVPAIEFESVSFIDVTNPSDPDSLIVAVRFKDGDGDLGLDANYFADTLFPYNSRFFYDTVRSNFVPYYCPNVNCWMGNPLDQPATATFISYDTWRNDRYGWSNKMFADSLPEFIKPYNCINWEVMSVGGKIDTFYFERNPYHHNIIVDYFVQQSNGEFKLFDWTEEFAYPQCGITFNGRFPVLSKDLSRKAALDGRIRYAMASAGFNILFSVKTLKLRIRILDRDLNVSNTVESLPFTLQQIRKSG